jgi:elongation factor G
MDRTGADFFGVVEQIHDRLGANAIPIQVPIGSEDTFKGVVDLIENKAIVWKDDDKTGTVYEYVDIPEDLQDTVAEWREKLVETIAETDDELLERYFEDPDSITVDEMIAVTRQAVLDRTFIPVMCGSAFKNKGVQRLLDAIAALMPSPLDIEAIEGTNPKTGETESRKPDDKEPLTALAFKIATDPFVGRLAFIRVYSGVLKAGTHVLNNRTGKKERISRLYQMHANKQNPKEEIGAGDICAAVGFKDIRTGDTLTLESHPLQLESMTFPDPVIGVAIEPVTQKDADKLGNALSKLAEEDPTFRVKTDETTGQTVISGMGELHLEIIVDRLKREFKVDCNQGQPLVNYKEAITIPVDHREVFKKQTGGRGKFADIIVKIEPAEEGKKGLEFINEIKGGNIPKEYIPSVEKGFKEAMLNGPLANYEVDSMKVTLIDGSFHPVDSDQLSFEICAKQAFKNAAAKANPIIMEPIMKVEVVTPEEYMGDVIADFNRRRGQVQGMEERGGAKVVRALVPLSEQFGYVTSLRTITSGRATSTMEFSHYAPVSPDLQKEIIEGKAK